MGRVAIIKDNAAVADIAGNPLEPFAAREEVEREVGGAVQCAGSRSVGVRLLRGLETLDSDAEEERRVDGAVAVEEGGVGIDEAAEGDARGGGADEVGGTRFIPFLTFLFILQHVFQKNIFFFSLPKAWSLGVREKGGGDRLLSRLEKNDGLPACCRLCGLASCLPGHYRTSRPFLLSFRVAKAKIIRQFI